MNTKHTPRPWKSVIHEGVGGCDYIQILAGSWDIVHNKHSARDWEEEKANARLIAASPELLEACRNLVSIVEQLIPDESVRGVADVVLAQGRAAIAKAEGGQ